uniref:Uncharacterized protein n=1 Tax=Arundo donax TaxID=35708 RepID=A0A0A9ABV2_ARUDO
MVASARLLSLKLPLSVILRPFGQHVLLRFNRHIAFSYVLEHK